LSHSVTPGFTFVMATASVFSGAASVPGLVSTPSGAIQYSLLVLPAPALGAPATLEPAEPGMPALALPPVFPAPPALPGAPALGAPLPAALP
jgi:hypothetical protein